MSDQDEGAEPMEPALTADEWANREALIAPMEFASG